MNMNTNTNTFNFKENAVETFDLQTLKSTYKENDIYGRPLKGIYHYQVIENIAEMCERIDLLKARYEINRYGI